MQPTSAPPALLDVGFVLTIVLIATALAGEPFALKLAVAVHMWLRIYDGRFAGWRKATWLALVMGQALLIAGAFLVYLLPIAQTQFWLAAKLQDLGAWTAQAKTGPDLFSVSVGVLSWIVIIADMVALHSGRRRSWALWKGVALGVVALLVAVAARDVLRLMGPIPPPTVGGLPTPVHIVPDTGMLSAYAVLRAVPDKTLGVALLGFVLLLPVAAAFTRGWRLHAPGTRTIWLGLSVALAASWIGLTFVGAQPATPATQWGALALVAYQTAFFLVAPSLLARRLQHEESPAQVFE